ncbi:DUF2809 domain-containing protein [Flavobacterium adhaerens]|uniref:ribosomal maturation YjgA family protein n=1 Tax=Flavobacterium adhaerens TaxID=3149043 RepID=UPI0032B4C601
MIKFNLNYFAITVLLFFTEIFIAMFVHDTFIRPYFGDFLVVLLIYCFLKSFLELTVTQTAILVLLFSFGIEFLQYLNIIKKLNLENSEIASIILGSSFSWIDILAYTLGIIFIIGVEFFRKK